MAEDKGQDIKQKKRARRGRRRKKKKTQKHTLSSIILMIAITIFLFSAFQLYSIYAEYHNGDKGYSELKERTVEEVDDTNVGFTVDFNALKDINPDVVGWIRFDEPSVISYPIVKGKDNSEYLNHTFEGKKNKLGAIFMDAENSSDFSNRNTMIYGHRMKNGSMFGKLEQYADQDFCTSNPYFYVYTPDGKVSTYQVFAAGVVTDTSDSYLLTYNSDEEFLKYIEQEKKASNYDIGVEVTADSQIISLSTCTRASDEHRFILHGVKIKEELVKEKK